MANTILCPGEALIDMICTDRDLPLTQGQHFEKKAGGAPMNVAAAVAAMGGHAELLAKIGTDPFGDFLADTMRTLNIGTRWVVRDAGNFTTMAYVSLMACGDRDFYFQRGADGQLTAEEAESVPLGDIALVHFGSATAFLGGPLQKAYTRMLERAITHNKLISFDPNFRQQLFAEKQPGFIEQSLNFIHRAHFCKLSAGEALLITGARTVDAAAKRFLNMTPAVFAITLGPEGALLGFRGKVYPVPGVEAPIVDSTGAGDAFTGSVLCQLSNKDPTTLASLTVEDWRQYLRTANHVAAQTCGYVGAIEAYRHIRPQRQ